MVNPLSQDRINRNCLCDVNQRRKLLDVFCGLLSPRCAIIKVLMSMEFKRLQLTQKKKRIEASPPRLEVSRSLSSAGSHRVLWSAKTRVFTRREEHARLSCPHPITAQCCKRAPADWTLWRGGILSALMCRFFQVVGTSKVPHTLGSTRQRYVIKEILFLIMPTPKLFGVLLNKWAHIII